MRRSSERMREKYSIRAVTAILAVIVSVLNVQLPGRIASLTDNSDMGIPSQVYAADEMNATGIVNNNKLNVRSGPSKEDDVIGQLKDGDEVDITGVDGDWYRIEYDEEVGYVAAKYIELKSEDDVEDPSDETQDNEEANGEKEEMFEAADEDVKPTSGIDLTTAAIIAAIILLLVIIIFATVKSIRNLSDEEDYYEDDPDDYGDEDYPEYEDDYPEDDYPDDEEDYPEEDDEYPEDEYQEEDYDEEDYPEEDDRLIRRRDSYREEPIPPALKAVRDGADPARYMSDNPEDYRIDIDPKYFEKTATLPDLTEVLEDDKDAPKPVGSEADTADEDAPRPIGSETDAADEDAPEPIGTDKDAQLAAAYKKMEELREELERIKNEQT